MQITRLPHIVIAVVSLATYCQCTLAAVGGSAGEAASTRSRSRRYASNNLTASSDTTQGGADLWSSSEEMVTSLEGGPGSGGVNRWLSHKESQMLLKREGGERGLPVDCCPSIMEIIQPLGGINRDGLLVRLFRDTNITQSFFELSCRTGVEGKPCRFMDRHLHAQSRCVQKYSYSYALVEDKVGVGTYRRMSVDRPTVSRPDSWMLDHIQVRSGCACEVLPRTKRRKSKTKRGGKE